MKCQFCEMICLDTDELQVHQVGSCPAIEHGQIVKAHPIGVVFRWRKDRLVEGNIVHIILSDVDNNIELVSETNPNRYESGIIPIFPGKYAAQIIIGNNNYPSKLISIDQYTTFADVTINLVDSAKEILKT